MSEMKFPSGIYFNEKHDLAPEFVLGSVSIQKDRFLEWLSNEAANEKGYIKLTALKSKKDPTKIYMSVDDGKTRHKQPDKTSEINYESEIKPEDLPF